MPTSHLEAENPFGLVYFIISATYSKWSQYSASGAVVNLEVSLLVHRNDAYFPGIKVSCAH